MQTTLKAKLLQHLLKKKQEGGFTLIELLVVIIIIGILAAIALPSFLNQANKARQSEAVTYTGSVNRAQQAYYLEQNHFSDLIAALGLGIQVETDNFKYGNADGLTNTLAGISTAAGNLEQDPGDPEVDSRFGGVIYAIPKNDTLKAFTGVTYLLESTTGEGTTTAVLCTSDNATDQAALPITATGLNSEDAEVLADDDPAGDCGG